MNAYLKGRGFAPRHLLLTLLPLLLAVASACGDAPERAGEGPPVATAADDHTDDEHGGDEHAEGEGDEVRLDAAGLQQAGIETAVAEQTALRGSFSAPGRAVPGLNSSAHVGTLVPGRVVRLYANEGAAVRQGSALAEIESFEVAELKADLIQARAALEQARAALERQQQLASENLTPERELEGARAAYQSAQAAVGAATTKLGALGISPGAVAAGDRPQSARFVVRAPIGGTVTRREVQLGEYIDPSRDLFEVASAGSNLVEAQVSAERASTLEVGQRVAVVLSDSTRYPGRIASVAPVVSAESRTVPVRITLTTGSLRPETFVTVRFDTDATREAVVLPAAALERAGGEVFVYVAVAGEEGTFRRTPVVLGNETAGGVEILSGLEPGTRVVVQGVFYLKSQRQKGELAEHDH